MSLDNFIPAVIDLIGNTRTNFNVVQNMSFQAGTAHWLGGCSGIDQLFGVGECLKLYYCIVLLGLGMTLAR